MLCYVILCYGKFDLLQKERNCCREEISRLLLESRLETASFRLLLQPIRPYSRASLGFKTTAGGTRL